MRHLTSLAAAAAFIVSATLAYADGIERQTLEAPEARSDVWESEAARSSSINATYIVGGILLAFLLVNTINDADKQ